MLRAVFGVVLCLLALQCYTASAVAPHLECEPFWDAITYCSGGRTAVENWEMLWCESCCMNYAPSDTGYDSNPFTSDVASDLVLRNSRSLNLAIGRANTMALDSEQDAFNRANFLASGASGRDYVPGFEGEPVMGPGSGTCCAGYTMSAGACTNNNDLKRQATIHGGLGAARCDLHWSVLGDGNCFIRRLASHLDPAEYRITGVGEPSYCTSVTEAVLPQINADGTFTQPSVTAGVRTIDKCDSNMNWCNCCRKRKSLPTFASWEYAAGPGLPMDHFDGLDSGDSEGNVFGPGCTRTASMISAGTCCAGYTMDGGVCTNNNDL